MGNETKIKQFTETDILTTLIISGHIKKTKGI